MKSRFLTHARRRASSLFLFGFIVLMTGFGLLQIDQRFNEEKREKLIQDETFDPQMKRASFNVGSIQQTQIAFGEPATRLLFAQLYPAGNVYLATPTGRQEAMAIPFQEVTEEIRGPISEILAGVIEGDNIFFRAEFYPCLETNPRVTATTAAVAVENKGKFRRLNTSSNNLVTRDFENVVLYRMGHTGNVRLYYTSPTGAAWMPALLGRYRWYALGVLALGLAALAALVKQTSERPQSPPKTEKQAANGLSTAGGRI